MKKKKFSILVLLMVLVIVFTAALFAACDDNKSDDQTTTEIEPTEGLLISNSDFKAIGTSGDWPRTVTDWTGGKIYSSSTVPGDVIAGAVSLEEAAYSAGKSLWGDDDSAIYEKLRSHYSSDADAVNNVLMIYMPADSDDEDDDVGPTAYGYTSKSFSLDAGSYYELSVDVLTYDIAGDDEEGNVPGARIYLSSTGYAEISGIDTKGEWKTYKIYIESAPSSASSLTLNLGLGKRSSYYTQGMTTGYAFFDNVTLTKVNTEDVTVDQAKAEFDEKAAEEANLFYAALDEYNEEIAAAGEDEDKLAAVKSLDARYSALPVRTMSLMASNGRFDFGSTSISTSAPSGWSTVTGDGADTNYRFNGVILSSALDLSKYGGTYYYNGVAHTPASVYLNDLEDVMGRRLEAHETVGDSVYMLSQQLMTAQGIKSSRSIVIEKNGFYALSVDVLTRNVYGGGVSLILTGDGEDIKIEGIAENAYDGVVRFGEPVGDGATTPANGEWTTYTFYIRGNQYKDMSYTLTLWLGTGSAEENTKTTYDYYSSATASATSRNTYKANGTFASGWAFFDDVTLLRYADETAFTEASKDAYNGYEADGSSYTSLLADLSSDSWFTEEDGIDAGSDKLHATIRGDFTPGSVKDEFTDGTNGMPYGFDHKPVAEDDKASAPEAGSDIVTLGSVDLTDEEALKAFGISAAPGIPYDLTPETGFMIHASSDTAYAVKSDAITIRANKAYSVSVWVKTDGVKDTSGAYLYLMTEGEKEGDDDVSLASFTAVNTAETETNNGWAEYTFYIKGSSEGKEQVWLEFALGSGTKWDSATLTSGAVFFANMSMVDVTYSDFSDATSGTYVAKADLAEAAVDGSFSNGSFDNIDYDELEEALTADDNDGTLQNGSSVGVPEDWTLSDQTLVNKDGDNYNENFVAGVLKAKEESGSWVASKQMDALFGDDYSLFAPIYGESDPLESRGAPSMLVIAGKNGSAFAEGYLSDSFTLDASGNYSLSVWAKADNGTTGMIFLQGEASGALADDEDGTLYFTFTGNGAWHKYTFNIEVGLTDVSLRLGLWLGTNADMTGEDEVTSSGAVLYDSVTLHEGLDDDDIADYESASYETVKRISFYTDSFDTMEGDASDSEDGDETELSSPNGWTGAPDTDQERDNSDYGVLDTSSMSTTAPSADEDDEDDGFAYVVGLGPELELDDFSATDDEIEKYYKDHNIDSPTAADAEAAENYWKNLKYKQAIKDRMFSGIFPENFVDGDNVLVINNLRDSAFRYTSSSYTLSAETAYKITVRVFTYGIGHVDDNNVFTADPDHGAFIEMYLGSSAGDDDPLLFANINTGDGWTEYTMYVLAPSEDVTSVTLRLGLGRYDADDESGLVTGYAFFDAVTVKEISETEYANAKDELPEEGDAGYGTVIAYDIPEEAEQGATGDDEETTDVPDNHFNLDSLWWMIPTIVIGLAIIAVVIVYFVKKYKKKFTKKAPDEPVDGASSSNVNRKKDDYDSFNE